MLNRRGAIFNRALFKYAEISDIQRSGAQPHDARLIIGDAALLLTSGASALAADYPGVTFTAGQQGRLAQAFPTGVCDWSKPGVGQQDPIAPLTYKAGPGGVALPPAPRSSPV